MLTPIIEALVQAGATPEMILAAVKAYEYEREIKEKSKREKDASRQRRHRLSRDVTVTNGDSCDTPPNGFDSFNGFPCTPSLTSLTSLSPHKENPPKGGQKKVPQQETEIPDWMPLAEWEGFKEMRLKIKKPMTLRAERIAIGKLERFRANGHDPTLILNQSILNDWQDLFEPRDKTQTMQTTTTAPSTSETDEQKAKRLRWCRDKGISSMHATTADFDWLEKRENQQVSI